MAAKLKCSAPCLEPQPPQPRGPGAMLLRQRSQVGPLLLGVLLQLLLLLLLAHSARPQPQRLEDIANQITPHGGPDRSGNFNVFFIPAYRLTGNKTGHGLGHGGTPLAAAPAVSPSAPPPLRLDPRTSARLLTAALSAAARLTAAPSPPPPAHTTPVPTLPPPRAGLVRRAPQDGDDGGDLPPQRHDAHILVTLQNYGSKEAAGASAQPAAPPPQGAVGYGSAQHFNNYPSVNGHVPAHFGPIPYYSHFPVAAPGTGLGLTGPSAPSGPAGLLYQPLPRFSAAASALDLVSSSPLGVNPGTLLGTTGPLYATPGRPAGTLANLGSLGSLANAAASATVQDTAATTTTDADQATTNVPVTTTTAAPATSSTTTTTPSTTEATATSRDPKADAELEVEPRTTPFRQTFEFGRSDSSRRLNLTEEVEVTASLEDTGAGGAEPTTPPPPTAATQQTSPATATEVRDLNSPSPTPPQSPAPTERAETEPPSLPPGPPYHFHPGGFPDAYSNGPYTTGAYPLGAYPTGSYPTGAYPPGAYPNPTSSHPGGVYPTGAYHTSAGGVPLNGYHPADFRFRDDPYRDPRFQYQPQQHPQQPPAPQKQPKKQGGAGAPVSPAVSRNPNHFGGNYDPFGAFVPGFAPGYPFGVPPHGVDQRGQPVTPFGPRAPAFGPPYGPFPATGSGSTGGSAGGNSGGSSSSGASSGTSSGGGASSQEATDDADDARQPPARLQAATGAGPSGSGEDLSGGQPFRQQLQPFGGFGGQLPQLPYSAFQSTAPGGGFPGAPNSFYRGTAASPTAFGQAPGTAGVAPPALANFNSANQFASDDFLGRQQRLHPLYPGASAPGGGQQQQQLRSQLFTPQQGGAPTPAGLHRGLAGGLPGGVAGLGGLGGLGGLDGGRSGGGPGGSLFGAQQPFAFNNPLFFSGSLDRDVAGDVEPRQSRITSYTASSSGGGLKAPEQDKLVSAKVNSDEAVADDDLLGPVVGTLGLGSVSGGHHLERREDRRGRTAAAQGAPRVGFYSATRR